MEIILLKEIIINRHILVAMIKRDLRARYVGSALGVFWSVINPLIMLSIYIVLFSKIWNVKIGGKGGLQDFAIYLCCALFPWNAMSESIIRSSNVIIEHSSLIKRVSFPQTILPLFANLSSFVHLFIAYGLFIIFLIIIEGPMILIYVVFLPFIFFLQLIFTLGPSYFFATINVFFRDTSQILGAVFTFLFWGTPIVYSPDIFKIKIMHYWFIINPFYQMVNIYRDILMYKKFPNIISLVYLIVLSFVMLVIGVGIFQRSKRKFVDEV